MCYKKKKGVTVTLCLWIFHVRWIIHAIFQSFVYVDFSINKKKIKKLKKKFKYFKNIQNSKLKNKIKKNSSPG